MKKVVRLTENDLMRIVKRIIKEESTNIKLPKVGDRLRISNPKDTPQSYTGDVVKIWNNYMIYLKDVSSFINPSSPGQKCAQYVWKTEGINMEKEGYGFHITDPNFELKFKVKPC